MDGSMSNSNVDLPVDDFVDAAWNLNLARDASAPLRWWRLRGSGGSLPIQDEHVLGGTSTKKWTNHVQLPLDYARTAIDSYTVGSVSVRLPLGHVCRLAKAASMAAPRCFEREDALLGAWMILLYRLSQQDEIGVALTAPSHMGRIEDPSGENVIEMSVLSMELGDHISSAMLLRHVAAKMEQVRHEERDGFAKADRDGEQRPMMLDVVSLPNVLFSVSELNCLSEQRHQAEEIHRTPFELALKIIESGEGWVANFDYAQELFSRQTVERLGSSYLALLGNMAADADQSVGRVGILSEVDRIRVLEQFNATQQSFDTDLRLHELFEAQVDRTPWNMAVTDGDQSLSYRELNAKANQLARCLRENGIRTGDLVGLSIERSADMIVAVFAILKAGAAYVPLDPAYPLARIAVILDSAQPKAILTQERFNRGALGTTSVILTMEWASGQLAAYQPANIAADLLGVVPSHLAYVIYTSGSTGTPKGVAIEHRNAVNLIQWALKAFGAAAYRETLQSTSLNFDLSVYEIFAPLSSGGCVRVVSDALSLTSSHYPVTLVNTVPSAIVSVLDSGSIPSETTMVNLAGEALKQEVVGRLFEVPTIERVNNLYGPSETTTYSTWCCMSRETGFDSTIGVPVANTSVYILDRNREPLPIGVSGELYIGGDGVARGYLNRPDLTADRFIADLFSPCGGKRMYRTGDVGRWRPDGTIEYLGRNDHQVKIRGFRIELGEIEEKLLRQEAVKEAVVVAQEGAAGETKLVSYIVVEESKLRDLDGEKSNAESEALIGQWQQLYEATYAKGLIGPSFIGWNSSYTGEALPQEQMRDWLANTVARIRELKPRRILEIGCGLGLLIERLAPFCETYVATDYSAEAIHRLCSWVASRPDLRHVRLEQCEAREVTGPLGFYDLVVINSVVQYFPDGEYLDAVIGRAVKVARLGGTVFIGDVRHLALLRAFHSSVQLERAESEAKDLKGRVDQAVELERELVVSPVYFTELPERMPEVAGVHVWPKQTAAPNELTLFRYDVVLDLGASGSIPVETRVDWSAHRGTIVDLYSHMREHGVQVFAIRQVCNARLGASLAAMRLIDQSGPFETAGALREILQEFNSAGEDPESFLKVGSSYGYRVRISWKEGYEDGSYDVENVLSEATETSGRAVFVRRPADKAPSARRFKQLYVNSPLTRHLLTSLLSRCRETLRRQLPKYMIPSAFMVLAELPRNTNGKLDRSALPPPRHEHRDWMDYEPPIGATEEKVAMIWKELLRLDRVDRRDNFFELGGHSLLIVQMTERLQQNNLPVNGRSLFETPTLAEFSREVAEGAANRICVPSNRIPLGCELIEPRMLPLIDLTAVHIARIVDAIPGGAANVQDVYPLSPMQEGMLFHYLLDRNAGDTYVHVILLSLGSTELLQDFICGLQKVIDRHDTLRTAILWEQLPRAVQVVYREAKLPVETLLLDSRRDAVSQTREHMRPERQRLDLSRAPLMRLQVSSGESERHPIALLQIHHIVHDLESLRPMFSEVIDLIKGKELLPAGPPHYRDHVFRRMNREQLSHSEKFFSRKFADLREPVLAFGLRDAQVRASEIEEADGVLEGELAHEIRRAARRLGVTVTSVFHAAWALVAAWGASRSEAVFGTVLSGRLNGNLDLGSAVGLFINTLPLRLRLEELSAVSLVRRAHQELIELLRYEQAPLSQAINSGGTSSAAPLFNSILNYYRSAPFASFEPQETGLDLHVLESRNWTNYPIAISIHDRGSDFSISVQAQRTVSPHSILAFLSTSLDSLTVAIEKSPLTPALYLQVMPNSMIPLRAESRARTDESREGGKSIDRLFEEQVYETPDAVALVYNSESITYTALNSRAEQLARRLKSKGAQANQLVGLYLERGVSMIIGIIAVLKAGAGYLPLDPESPSERTRYILGDAAPSVVLTEERFLSHLSLASCETIALNEGWWKNSCCETSDLKPDSNITLGSRGVAYVIYTSGSTGRPKGVVIEHRNVTRLFSVTSSWAEFAPSDVWTLFHSYAFDFSVWELWGALLYGGRVIIVPPLLTRSPQEFYHLLCRESVTVLSQTPGAFKRLIDAQQAQSWLRDSLRLVVFGGERLDLSSLRPWTSQHGARTPRLVNMYGITETTVHVTWKELTESEIRCESTSLIGRPISDLEVYLLDAQGQPVPHGVKGEIYVGGEGVARGYLNQPQLTAQRFLPDPFSQESSARMYRSGDLGVRRIDGTLEYIGRNDDQVKIRGFRIELGEIEDQLVQQECVKDAAVIAREDNSGEARLVAYIVPTDPGQESKLLAEALRFRLRQLVPPYMVPSDFVFLTSLPLTNHGKLDRAALPAPDIVACGSSSQDPPREGGETTLARIWESALRVSSIGRADNFFELGGHSLIALKVVLQVNEVFSQTLSVADLYRYPILSEFASRLTGAAESQEEVDLAREAVLDPDVRVRSETSSTRLRSILLTGGTGFVGRFLLQRLIQESNATIYCLVRGTARTARDRLERVLSQWNLRTDELDRRIVVVAGDLGQPRLGLESGLYRTLCDEVDTVYHCATSMNHLETYWMAKPTNVGGAVELLRFATMGYAKSVNVISTLSVFGMSDAGRFRIVDEQSSIERERHSVSAGYAASKWVSEKLFVTAMQRGVPCNVFRLGLVWADGAEGRYDELQREDRLFRSCLLTGLGIKNYQFEMIPTPVDHVSEAVVFLSKRHGRGGGIFHISSTAKTMDGIFERCNELKYTSLRLLDFPDWIAEMRRLHNSGNTLPIVPLIEPLFSKGREFIQKQQAHLENGQPRIQCAKTSGELLVGGICAPLFDETLLHRYLAGLADRGIHAMEAVGAARVFAVS